MPRANDDGAVDGLYQLPLAEFTAARNALAKASGPRGADIRALGKPPLAAWAINQVFWRRREVYDELTAAATAMRQAHADVLAGRHADPRSAGRRHEDAVEAALRAATSILHDDGQTVTDATKQAMATTLRALPASDVPPGRLDRTLQPGGFEMLAGIALASPAPGGKRTPRPSSAPPAPRVAPAARAGPDRRLEQARAAAAEAVRDLRSAEHAREREEFKASRAVRDVERAEREVAAAEAAVEEAQAALAGARRDHDKAQRTREEAEARIESAETRVADARRRVTEAEAAVRKLARST